MEKFFYGIVYFLIFIEPLVNGHIKSFISLPFTMAFLIFLARGDKERQCIHYIVAVFLLGLSSSSFFVNVMIFAILYCLIELLNKRLPLEYFLKDIVLSLIVNTVFFILANATRVKFTDFISLSSVFALIVQVVFTLIYLIILKKMEGIVIGKNEKTNRYG